MKLNLLIYNLDTNPKGFWRYVNSRLKTHSTIDDILCPDGHSVHNDTKKVILFNQFFSSVFTKEDLSHIPELNIDPVPPLNTVSLSS